MAKTRQRTSQRNSAPRDIYQEVTDTVIAHLDAGVIPWRKPWSTDYGMPLRMTNRKPYRGINLFLLAMQADLKGYNSPYWGTFNRIAALDGVDTADRNAMRAWGGLRGERATMVIFWRRISVENRDSATNGGPEKVFVPLLRHYNVFNLDQVSWQSTAGGAPERWQTRKIERTAQERIEAAEAIVAGYPNPPRRATGSAAYYTMHNDTITLPPFADFDSAEEYYSTNFHEMIHSTGVEDRCNVPGFTQEQFGHFGSEIYGKEELRAEMGAAFLSGRAGFDTSRTLPNSASYLASWLRGEDPRTLVRVAAQAQRAADHILNESFTNEEEENQ